MKIELYNLDGELFRIKHDAASVTISKKNQLVWIIDERSGIIEEKYQYVSHTIQEQETLNEFLEIIYKIKVGEKLELD